MRSTIFVAAVAMLASSVVFAQAKPVGRGSGRPTGQAEQKTETRQAGKPAAQRAEVNMAAKAAKVAESVAVAKQSQVAQALARGSQTNTGFKSAVENVYTSVSKVESKGQLSSAQREVVGNLAQVLAGIQAELTPGDQLPALLTKVIDNAIGANAGESAFPSKYNEILKGILSRAKSEGSMQKAVDAEMKARGISDQGVGQDC